MYNKRAPISYGIWGDRKELLALQKHFQSNAGTNYGTFVCINGLNMALIVGRKFRLFSVR